MYSNSYSFYNNVYMTNEKNKLNIFTALILGISILLLTGQRKIETLLSFNLFISLTIFTILSIGVIGILFEPRVQLLLDYQASLIVIPLFIILFLELIIDIT